jgi:hypothetical protein
MERRVTVNDRIERVELEVPEGLEGALQEEAPAEKLMAPREGASVYGPCLYLGPAGERCARAALQGGYCARHHIDPEMRSDDRRNYTRVIVASIALVIVIWPYISDLLRDLVRWLALPR